MDYIKCCDGVVLQPYTNSEMNDLGRIYYEKGKKYLSSKKFAVVILAGGQGSRLGFNGPKGTFKIENKTLFEWHIEDLIDTKKTYDVDVKLIIMVSSSTEVKTREFFDDVKFELDIEFVVQDDALCKDREGNPLEYFSGYVKAPNGNGDVFRALKNINMDKFDAISVMPVDNVLAKPLDPVFVGAFFENDFDVLNKSITKMENENLGVFKKDDDYIKIVEYTDDFTGGNEIQGNVGIHMFKGKFFKEMAKKSLPIHLAFKKIPYTYNGKIIKPTEPNAYKPELFIFDCFEYTKKVGVMNVIREMEFSPLKNGPEAATNNHITCARSLRLYRSVSSE